MPFDQDFSSPAVAAPIAPVRGFAPVSDDVLRLLHFMRNLHSDPARWCNTGMGDHENTFCIFAAETKAQADLNLWNASTAEVLQSVLPAGCESVVAFNERCGATHGDLMRLYDRAIAARKAEGG